MLWIHQISLLCSNCSHTVYIPCPKLTQKPPRTLYTPPSLTNVSFPYQPLYLTHFLEFLFQPCLIPLISSPHLLPRSLLSTCPNLQHGSEWALKPPFFWLHFLFTHTLFLFPTVYTLFLPRSHPVVDSFTKHKYEGKLPQGTSGEIKRDKIG